MPAISKNLMRIAATALLVTVLTQVLYIALNASGTPLALNLWRTEAVAFLIVALTGAAMIAGRPLIGAGLAVGGILNVMQAGMGLVMFGPLSAGGEALGPVFQAVLAMAFFLYFAGKVSFAAAGVVLGSQQWKEAAGARRIVGGLAALSGAIALLINLAAMVMNAQLTFYAGASGTAAALFLGLALLMQPSAAQD